LATPSPCAAATDQPIPDGSGNRPAIGSPVRRKHNLTALRIADDGVSARSNSPARRSMSPMTPKASSLSRFSMTLRITIAD